MDRCEEDIFYMWWSRCMNVQFDEWLIVIRCCLHTLLFSIYSKLSLFFFSLLYLIYTIEIATVERSHVVVRWKFDICGQILIQVKYWKEEDTIRKDIDKAFSSLLFVTLYLILIGISIYVHMYLFNFQW